MSNRLTYIIAGILFFLMFSMALLSILDDSFTFDETAHITAGFAYLTQRDMRLNPEHPPLIKDLAALPLLFLNLNFPEEHPAWTQKEDIVWWYQFNLASQFLYNSGNNPDQILFWSRLPMILILVLLGWFLFRWAKELFGNKTAVLALFLFSFSPTLLAHGRLITTDVGAAAGAFIATYYFIKSLQSPTKKNIILAGITFGLAELSKFTVIILIPFFAFLALIWWLIKSGKFIKTLKTLILILIIGYILIGLVYQYHVWDYPPERQARDIKILLSSHPFKFLGPALAWAAEKPLLRPYAEYLLGLAMVYQRGTGGNTTYFLGEISAAGWVNYFPVIYSIKEPLAFHILTLIALFSAALIIKKPFWEDAFQRMSGWIKSHFPEFSMMVFIAVYWGFSLMANLNIGVRHLLPALPFTIIMVSGITISWLKEPFLKLKYVFLGILILWQAVSVFIVYPHFLAYFNELAGGPDNGYIYAVDSNLDWGQDLKRLRNWLEENNIEKIYVDYFGGGNLEYYLKEKYSPWWGTRNPDEFPKENYLAVSASLLQGGRGLPAAGFDQPWGYYLWLGKYKSVAKIGYSIFVFYID